MEKEEEKKKWKCVIDCNRSFIGDYDYIAFWYDLYWDYNI